VYDQTETQKPGADRVVVLLWAEWLTTPAQLERLALGLTTENTTSKGMARNLKNIQETERLDITIH